MILHVFKRKRKRNGKTATDPNYSGRYRLNGDFATTTVALAYDRQAGGGKKLRDIVKEKEREREGLIAPKLERVAAEVPLQEHLRDFLADLKTRGRTEHYVKVMKGRIARLLKDCK